MENTQTKIPNRMTPVWRALMDVFAIPHNFFRNLWGQF